MQRYVILRFFQAIIALWVVSVIVFGMGRLTGNPADVLAGFEATPEQRERLKAAWGLDKPQHIQYLKFMGNAFKGEFGDSFKYQGRSVIQLIKDRLPNTLMLAGFSIAIATVIALPMGVLSAVKRDSIFDYLGKVVALFGQSAPPFWIGLLLMWIFAVELGLVQSSGKGGISSFILPGIALGWFWVAALMRLVRSAMLDVLDSEYIKLARIKGLAEWRVIWKHALRNAAIAPLTYFAIILGSLLVGSVSIETVFAWPGIGLLAFEAAFARDYQVIQGVVLLFCGFFVAANFLADILYAYLDPRIRYQ
jgi:peptide/nickel transport system permease protein